MLDLDERGSADPAKQPVVAPAPAPAPTSAPAPTAALIVEATAVLPPETLGSAIGASSTRRVGRRSASFGTARERRADGAGPPHAARAAQPSGTPICRFYLKGACTRSNCRFLHPSGGIGQCFAGACFLCGAYGHKKRDCPEAASRSAPLVASAAVLATTTAPAAPAAPTLTTPAEAVSAPSAANSLGRSASFRRRTSRRSASFGTARERRAEKPVGSPSPPPDAVPGTSTPTQTFARAAPAAAADSNKGPSPTTAIGTLIVAEVGPQAGTATSISAAPGRPRSQSFRRRQRR